MRTALVTGASSGIGAACALRLVSSGWRVFAGVRREGDEQAPIAVAAAKSYAGDAAVAACERAIQVLGGIGFTWEHPLHTYYKRALRIQAYGGYSREQRAKIAAWLLD